MRNGTRMRAIRGLGMLALFGLLAVPALPAGEAEFRWRGRVASGQAIEVKGVSGGIEAVAASGSDVEVEAVKRSRRSDPAEVEIKVVEHGGGVTVCAVYPHGSWSRPNECAPGEGGRMSVRDNDVEVDFTVRVPAGVRFVGRTVNGDIEAASLPADVEAYTVNGGVRIATAGHARAETVNGSITASLGRADWTGPVDFQTVNGSITLDLPAGLSADVQAQTVNGDIETDFPLAVQGRFSRRRVSGTIGSGGRELKLRTVNGGIRLRRSP